MSTSSSQRGENGGRRRQRRSYAGDSESSSSLSTSSHNGVWPEPFLEALVTQVAIDAARGQGRLAAGLALVTLFQVNSTWRSISRSESLWRRLANQIWGTSNLSYAARTWHEEYVRRHCEFSNFRTGRYSHAILHFDASDTDDPGVGLHCRTIAISTTYLACGFGDGAVRVFSLRTHRPVVTLRPHSRDHFGRFSRAVSGIILSDGNVIFGSICGDVHLGILRDVRLTRRIVYGDIFTDGAMVDFTGCRRWWVGLYAGVAGRAFHVWNAVSEDLVYVGGTLTDPEAVIGWRQFSEIGEPVGRVRFASPDWVFASTSRQAVVYELILGEGLSSRFTEDYLPPLGIIVNTVDADNGHFLAVESGGETTVRRVEPPVEVVCVFSVGRRPRRRVMGCMNSGHALMWSGGRIRVWDVERGVYLYALRERLDAVSALAANDLHVAAYCSDTSIHLWTFA